MSNLTRTIESLAADFARNVLAALRDASLSDLAGVGSSGAPARRSVVAAPVRGARAGGKSRAWPKCETCGKNAHPRGKGYCWEHALAAGVAKGSGGPGKLGKRGRRAKKRA